jgi:hypothetical protein
LDGAVVWERRYDGSQDDDSANAVAVDAGGNVFVTGYAFDGTNEIYTAKYAAADGTLLWEVHAHGGGAALVVEDTGNPIVAGNWLNGSNSDFVLWKTSQS